MSDANLILPRLWLGNKKASMDTEFLTKNNITVVFNCTKDLPFHTGVLHRYRVPVDDNLEDVEIRHMYEWAPEIVFKLLHEYKAGNAILVHCFAGMQRSAAVIALFLMYVAGESSNKTMNFIRKKRPVAFFPAANFLPAIQEFEKALLKVK